MTGGPHCIGIALIVVLAERFVLDGRLGRTPFSDRTKNFAAALADTGIIAAVLTAGAAVAWPVAALLLIPAGAVYCYAPVLMAAFLMLALAAEPVFSRWWPFFVLNRIFARAAVVSSLLGFMVLVPQMGNDARHAVAFTQSVATAALTGAVFAVTRLLYHGVRERVVYIGNGRAGGSLAQELAAAGLIALVLAGISTLNFFR